MSTHVARSLLLSLVAFLITCIACAQPVESQTGAPAAQGLTVVEAPPDDTGFYCLATNPVCSQPYPWWAAWDAAQSRTRVTYRFPPHLITEERFVQAVWLLWQWPEGRQLLLDATARGLVIVGGPVAPPAGMPTGDTVFGEFDAQTRRIVVGETYTQVSTVWLAEIISHEARHAADAAAGIDQHDDEADCIAREQRARETERDYVQWLVARFGPLPAAADVRAALSPADNTVFGLVAYVAQAQTLDADTARLYQPMCSA